MHERGPRPPAGGSVAQSCRDALAELHGAEDELEKFFDEASHACNPWRWNWASGSRDVQAGARRQAEAQQAVADCRRQFRVCLEELQEVQADARDAREETRRVWAEVRAAQEQALRQYTELGQAHAALLEELERVRSLLEKHDPRRANPNSEIPNRETAVNHRKAKRHQRIHCSHRWKHHAPRTPLRAESR